MLKPKYLSSSVPAAIMLGSACTICLWPVPSFAQNGAAELGSASSQPVPTSSPGLAPEQATAQQPAPVQVEEAPSTDAHDLQTVAEGGSFRSDQIRFDSHLSPTLIVENTPDANAVPTDKAVDAQKPFSIHFGSRLPDPTALKGPTRVPIVYATENIDDGIGLSGGVQASIGKSLKLFAEVRGGESILGGDLSLFYGSDDLRSGFAANVFSQQSQSPSFDNGRINVRLPNGRTPWVDRLGGGVEFHHPFSRHVDSAVGVTYQTVTVRDKLFGSTRQPVDQVGNQLTVSPSGRDDLLTLNLALGYDNRDSADRPTNGTHVRFGVDQSIPVGDASITMTRVSASASQFVRLPFFFKKRSTLVFNVQGGHIFGDAPPYESFNLGGDTTVRGFNYGAIGTGSSFIEASIEYRFPLFAFRLLQQPIAVNGALFVDYGTLLGTQGDVIGRPGIVRNKPGDGLGYGAGVIIDTRFGIAQIDAGLNDQGGGQAHVSIGERF